MKDTLLKSGQAEMKSTVSAILEEMEATNLEANLEEIESESEHQEVPNEEAAVETAGTLEDQHLAVGGC